MSLLTMKNIYIEYLIAQESEPEENVLAVANHPTNHTASAETKHRYIRYDRNRDSSPRRFANIALRGVFFMTPSGAALCNIAIAMHGM